MLALSLVGAATVSAQQTDDNQLSNGCSSQYQALLKYDHINQICWLREGNVGANSEILDTINFASRFPNDKIDANGMMDNQTALDLITALKDAAYLGVTTWQLPDATTTDYSCAEIGPNNATFGPDCSKSAMGSLYYKQFNWRYAHSSDAGFGVSIDLGNATNAIQNITMGYYWATAQNTIVLGKSKVTNQEVFSFANGQGGGVTNRDNLFYLWPMVEAKLPGAPDCDSSSTPLVQPYTGVWANLAVFDCNTKFTWLANANPAASEKYTLTGKVKLYYSAHKPPLTIYVPKDRKGAMLSAQAYDWLADFNTDPKYDLSGLGLQWIMPPTSADLAQLFADLKLSKGSAQMQYSPEAVEVNTVYDIQPFFYWACVGDTSSNASACSGNTAPENLQYSFNWDTGFTNTASLLQHFFVMVYYPVPAN